MCCRIAKRPFLVHPRPMYFLGSYELRPRKTVFAAERNLAHANLHKTDDVVVYSCL